MTRRNDPIAGALWMLLSCALLSGVAALGRYAALEGVPPFQIVFLRLLFALLTLLPLLLIRGPSMLQTDHLGLYAIRAVTGLLAMMAWFAALALISVGEVTAISFLTPIFATVGAALFLGETVRRRQWLATFAGLVGALIIMRPGFLDIGPGAWLAVAAAVGMAAASLFIKQLTNTDDPDKIVLISMLLQTPLALIPAVLVWSWPTTNLWSVLFAMGILATLGHLCLSRAFASADASLVMGVDFSRLAFAVFYGFVLFNELIDFWTWVGAGIIFVATLYATRHARRAQSEPGKAAAPGGSSIQPAVSAVTGGALRNR